MLKTLNNILEPVLKQFSVRREIMITFTSNASETQDYGYKKEKIIPAAERNKEPILQVLKRFISMEQDSIDVLFLEISSGIGLHIAHFAPNFPHITFQPSEYDKNNLSQISTYAKECITRNIKEPIYINSAESLKKFGFLPNTLDYIYNANMMQVSPFECTEGLFTNAGVFLKPDCLLITYGPYAKDGIITPQSNVDFHNSLKSQNPDWGIRDVTDLVKLGMLNKITLIDTIEMPANNKILIWKKDC